MCAMMPTCSPGCCADRAVVSRWASWERRPHWRARLFFVVLLGLSLLVTTLAQPPPTECVVDTTVGKEAVSCATSRVDVFIDGQGITALRAGCFEDMPSVSYLSLVNNEISVLPPGIFDPLDDQLKYLYLDGNAFTALPPGIFDKMSALEVLSLSGNPITSLPQGIFDKLQVLLRLDLDAMLLSSVPAGLFDKLLALQTLHLSGNQLSSFPRGIIAMLTHLVALYIDHNQLSGVEADAFASTPSITQLSLAHNMFEALPAGLFDQTTSMERLYLNNNNLASISPGLFDNMVHMNRLYLHNNKLQSLPAGFIKDAASIRELTVHNNSLASLPPNMFDTAIKLEYLAIDDVPLQPFAGTVHAQLQHSAPMLALRVTQPSQLATIGADVLRIWVGGLKMLDLVGRELVSVPADALVSCKNLTHFGFTNAPLARLPAGIFDGLQSLTNLWLDSLALTTLPAGIFDQLSSLRELDIRDTPITALPPGVFDKLAGLTTLGLRRTQLSMLPSMVFSALGNLWNLGLYDNLFEALPSGIFANVTAAKYVTLTGNPGSAEPCAFGTWGNDPYPFCYFVPHGMVVASATINVTEGGTASFTVSLDAAPSADVVLSVSRVGAAGGMFAVSPTTLTFSSSNWNAWQHVFVTAVDNAVAAGGAEAEVAVAVNQTATEDGSFHQAASARVTVASVDDDNAGIVLSTSALGSLPEGSSVAFNISLNSQPTADVVLALESATPSVAQVSPPTLTFTPSSWHMVQAATVTAVDNAVAAATSVASDLTVSVAAAATADTMYQDVPPKTLTVTSLDDDTAGIALSHTTLGLLSPARSSAFAVQLTSEPSSAVVLTATAGPLVTVTPATVTFDANNWASQQSIEVLAGTNVVVDTAVTVLVAVANITVEPTYKASAAQAVGGTILGRSVLVSPTALTIREGGTSGFFAVKLSNPPGSGSVALEVGVASSSGVSGAIAIQPQSLTFTAANWNMSTTVTVTGVDNSVDAVAAALVATVVAHPSTSSASGYQGAASEPVSVTVIDDDVAGFTLSHSSLAVPASGLRNVPVLAHLTSMPASGSVVLSAVSNDTGVVTVTPTALTFTASNWATDANLTVSGAPTSVDVPSGAAATITVAISSDGTTAPAYVGMAGSGSNHIVAVTVIDDDTVPSASIVLSSPSGDLRIAEPNTTDSLTVQLTTKPTGNVVVLMGSNDTSVATISPSRLAFTPSNWTAPQACTVAPVNEHIADGTTVFSIQASVQAAVLSAAEYASVVAATDGSCSDDEQPNLIASASNVTLDEGASGMANYSVVLDTEPAMPVTVAVTMEDVAGPTLTVHPASLVFTPGNWSHPQTVTVQLGPGAADGGNSSQFTIMNHVAAPAGSYTVDVATSVHGLVLYTDTDSLPGFVVPLVAAFGAVAAVGVVAGGYAALTGAAAAAKVAPAALAGAAVAPV